MIARFHRLILVATPLFMVSQVLAQANATSGARPAAPVIARAVSTLNGVFSPRGFFNITVRLYQLEGLEWAKFDLRKSRITLDFQPGVAIKPDQIRNVMVDAGYKPGPVTITEIPQAEGDETGAGWVRIKHPRSRNSVVRWFELNF